MEKILHGLGVSYGTASGVVNIIRSSKDYSSFQKGQILVTEITDPTMVPMMGKAAGIICEIGGLTSHPAIVSREMGIPCVVQVKNAMKVLKDGQHVQLNGETGDIHAVGESRDWIDEHSESFLNTVGAMDMGTIKPYDWYQFHPLFIKEWLAYVEKMIDTYHKKKLSPSDLFSHPFDLFPPRDCILFSLLDVKTTRLPKEKRLKIANFYNEVAAARYKKDKYGLGRTSSVFTQSEAEKLMEKIPFNEPNPEITRELGNIFSACYNLQDGLYLDFYMGYGAEYLGPFSAVKKFGKGAILVIRHFPDLKPLDVWPEFTKGPAKSLRIYSIYQNVSFQTDLFTCHGVFTGDTRNGLVKWALELDGKFISDPKKVEKISNQLGELSKNQWEKLTSQDFETIKQTGLWVRCYTHKPIMDKLGLDWKPTPAMQNAVKGKKFATNTFWKIPKEKEAHRTYFKKILDPRIDFFPPGSK
jgi:phosphohistidine swiveling domain-containing protein